MRVWLGICAAALVATSCGGATKRGAVQADSSPQGQIRALMGQNANYRQQLGMGQTAVENGSPDSTTTAGTAKDPSSRPQVKTTSPPRVRRASTCSDVCRITASICDNAQRICRIAKDKLPDDAWAQNQCTKATRSCTDARARCDKCRSK